MASSGPGKLSKACSSTRKILQDLTSNTGKITMVYVKVDDPEAHGRALSANLKKVTCPNYQIYSMDEFLSHDHAGQCAGLERLHRTVVGLAVMFGFLVVFLAMYTAVLERTREIGILKALGASPGYIHRNADARDHSSWQLMGSIIGIGLSYVAKWAIMTFVPSSLCRSSRSRTGGGARD